MPPADLHIDSHLLAEELHEMFADNERDKLNISVVSTGKAADHSLIGMLNFSFTTSNARKYGLNRPAGVVWVHCSDTRTSGP